MSAESHNYKWIVLGLLFVAHFVVQGVRQLYYASIPPIRADLGLGPTALGMVATVFLMVYGVCAPCASVVADLLRRKTIIVVGFFVFSVGMLAAGFAPSLAALVVCYGVVVAMGQSMVPSSSSAIPLSRPIPMAILATLTRQLSPTNPSFLAS